MDPIMDPMLLRGGCSTSCCEWSPWSFWSRTLLPTILALWAAAPPWAWVHSLSCPACILSSSSRSKIGLQRLTRFADTVCAACGKGRAPQGWLKPVHQPRLRVQRRGLSVSGRAPPPPPRQPRHAIAHHSASPPPRQPRRRVTLSAARGQRARRARLHSPRVAPRVAAAELSLEAVVVDRLSCPLRASSPCAATSLPSLPHRAHRPTDGLWGLRLVCESPVDRQDSQGGLRAPGEILEGPLTPPPTCAPRWAPRLRAAAREHPPGRAPSLGARSARCSRPYGASRTASFSKRPGLKRRRSRARWWPRPWLPLRPQALALSSTLPIRRRVRTRANFRVGIWCRSNAATRIRL